MQKITYASLANLDEEFAHGRFESRRDSACRSRRNSL